MRILHVGFPKTGTTATQKHLAKVFSLEPQVVVRMQSAESADSVFIRSLSRYLRGGITAEERSVLKNVFSGEFLVSAETILAPTSGSPIDVFAALGALVPRDTHIVISYRGFEDLLVSLYAESVKSHHYSSTAQFLQEGDGVLPTPPYFGGNWQICNLNLRSAIQEAMRHFATVTVISQRALAAEGFAAVFAGHPGALPAGAMEASERLDNPTLRMWQVSFLQFINLALRLLSNFCSKGSSLDLPYSSLRWPDKVRELPVRVLSTIKLRLLVPLFQRMRVGTKFDSREIRSRALLEESNWNVDNLRDLAGGGVRIIS